MNTAIIAALSSCAAAGCIFAVYYRNKTNKVMRSFAFVAHDIKSAASVVRNAAALQMARGTTEYNDILTRQSGVVCDICMDISLAIGAEIKNGACRRHSVDASQVVRHIVDSAAAEASMRKKTLSCLACPDCLVQCTRTAVERVVCNLMMNALNAAKSDVALSVRPSKDRRFVEIKIADDGKGMSQKEISKIYKPFFTNCDASGSLGLGLSSVVSVVQACEGRISVQSKVGESTVFTVLFPAVKQAD